MSFESHWSKADQLKRGYKNGFRDGYKILEEENKRLWKQLSGILNILQGENNESKEICNRGEQARGRKEECEPGAD